MDIDNEERASTALRAVEAFWGNQGPEELETKISDLLANLRHLCDAEKIDFNKCNARGQYHHTAEVEEEEEGA